MGNGKGDKGEFILLGFFALFVIVYLIDVSRLPIEGKLLSYVLAPFILIVLILCGLSVLVPSKEEEEESFEELLTHASHPEKEQEEKRLIKKKEKASASRRLYKTASMGIFLFASIYLLGFYLGSGVMLLIWFLIFRRINLTSILIIILTPLLLYLPFEKVLNIGLPEGALFKWLGY